MDLTGKLIIKAQLGDDIRRIPIHNEDITYDELMLMMMRVFRNKLTRSDEVMVKYKDEDGDLITIFDSADLCFAIQCSRILKLTLFVNGEPLPLETDEVQHIRKELQTIRNHVNHLLDSIEVCSSTGASVDGGSASETASSVDGNKLNASLSASQLKTARSHASGKEFDPLTLAPQRLSSSVEDPQKNVLSSFGLSAMEASAAALNLRSDTPDSVGSSSQVRYSPAAPNQYSGEAGGGGVQPMSQHPHGDGSQHNQEYYQDHSSGGGGYATGNHPQPLQTGYGGYGHQPQPVQTGYSQQQAQHSQTGYPAQQMQQPVQTGYNSPVQTGYAQHPQQLQQQHPQQQQMGGAYAGQQAYAGGTQSDTAIYSRQSGQPAIHQQPYGSRPSSVAGEAAPGTASPGGAGVNPYSRGQTQAQYPRPQQQYPQTAPTPYRQ